jgi:hypothetical protein
MVASKGATTVALITTTVTLFGCDSGAGGDQGPSCSSSDQNKLADPTIAGEFMQCVNACGMNPSCEQGCVDAIGLSKSCLACIATLDADRPDISKCGLHDSMVSSNLAGKNIFVKAFMDQRFGKGPMEVQNTSKADIKSLEDGADGAAGAVCSSRDVSKLSDPTIAMNFDQCMNACTTPVCEQGCMDALGLSKSCLKCIAAQDPANPDFSKCGLLPESTVSSNLVGNNIFIKALMEQGFSKGPVEVQNTSTADMTLMEDNDAINLMV